MNRILTAIILSIWVMFLGFISYGLGDYECMIETWLISFSLPIWSILTIGLWYDVGRYVFKDSFDSNQNKTPVWIRSLIFTFWMSIVLTYIVWVHLNIQAIQMLVVIPILSIPLRDWLIMDFSFKSGYLINKREQILGLLSWMISSYAVYWVLTILWIIIRVWLMDVSTDGFVYVIE